MTARRRTPRAAAVAPDPHRSPGHGRTRARLLGLLAALAAAFLLSAAGSPLAGQDGIAGLVVDASTMEPL
jgi:hypothetical protein